MRVFARYFHLPRAQLAFESLGATVLPGAFSREVRAMDAYSIWREVPAYAVYFARLSLDEHAEPVSFRPVKFLMSLFF
ncbi:hypothetical protein QCE49_18805 [Caballeronia sp. LZ008]|uniref:hypothetical protein n=1 Tax=unclassified Caballeronia TaxID=2646786 RepID=UPI00202836C2|nr:MULTISPECIES: hypothetical protein [unclassified Caballeronia]MDR5795429.1 hypothetical protein [Caballeronia sp. LZ008]